MNIFVLDSNPIKSAQLQCNTHIVKMIVESAQMLSTAHRMLDGLLERRPSKSGKTIVKYWRMPDWRENTLYKAVHMYHPCTVWTLKSNNNYNWHWIHFAALCDEYKYRYEKVHATDTQLRNVLKTLPENIPVGAMTPQPLAMTSNPECMDPNNVVESYRKFYQTKQHRFKMAWTKRKVPEWFEVAA